VLFSHPKDFTPVCTTELGSMARLKPEFDRRNTKIIGLSVDPVENHARWSNDILESQGHAPNFPDDRRHHARKSPSCTACCRPSTEGTSEGRTAVNNQTVRTVFVIGPDKKVKLMIAYPMTTRPELPRSPAGHRLAAAHREPQGGDAGQLGAGRGRHHCRLGVGRGREEGLSAGMARAAAVPPVRAPAGHLNLS
jgi:hypothetical protein